MVATTRTSPMLPTEIMLMITDHYSRILDPKNSVMDYSYWAGGDIGVQDVENFLMIFPQMSRELYKLVEEAEGVKRQLHKTAWEAFASSRFRSSHERHKRLAQEVELALKQRLFFSHIKHEVRWSKYGISDMQASK